MRPDEVSLTLDAALYERDPVVRDGARGRLAREGGPEALATLIALLDAPQRATRRRAARVLSEARPSIVRPLLAEALADANRAARARVSAARVLTVLADAPEPALAVGLRDADARVRRACLSPATPTEALHRALSDADAEVTERAAAVCAETARWPQPEALTDAPAAPSPAWLRLLARVQPTHPALLAATAAGDLVALEHAPSVAAAQAGLTRADPDAQIAAAWSLARLAADPTTPPDATLDALRSLASAPDPTLRAAAARALPPADPALLALSEDPDPGVTWIAQRARGGRYTPDTLARRAERHARLDAASARPPYGLRPEDADTLEPIQRAHAALALCHTRFDVNLGVAVRSAEAAGLREVFLVGRGELLPAPARGTDLLLPIRHAPDAASFVRMARAGGYQLVAVQQTPDAEPWHRAEYPPRPVFILGAEDTGVPPELRRAADLVVEIPLHGAIDSLNVAAAATAVLFMWRALIALRDDGNRG